MGSEFHGPTETPELSIFPSEATGLVSAVDSGDLPRDGITPPQNTFSEKEATQFSTLPSEVREFDDVVGWRRLMTSAQYAVMSWRDVSTFVVAPILLYNVVTLSLIFLLSILMTQCFYLLLCIWFVCFFFIDLDFLLEFDDFFSAYAFCIAGHSDPYSSNIIV